MSSKTFIIIFTITIFVIKFASSRPFFKQNSSLKTDTPLQFHKLIKRAAAFNNKGSYKTGFAAIIETPKTRNIKRTRECLEWKKHPLTGKMKCIKFAVHS